jgi:probable O-glycosylation ligase (exosortase A-associated)
MRGFVFFMIFILSLPFIFVSPFNGVLIWYVFSLGNFHTLAWGFFSDLYYAYIIAILTCFSWLISPVEKKQLRFTPSVILTLLFSLWMTITSLFALAPQEDVWAKWATVQKILFMCLVGFALTTTRRRIDLLIWTVVLSVGFWGVKGAISFPLHGGGSGIHGPEGGVTADNNEFGVALVMLLPLLFYLWHITGDLRVRRGLKVMGILITFATIFTYSRGAALGLCAMGFVVWLRSSAKLAVGAVIVVGALSVYAIIPQDWFDRMNTIGHYEQDSSAMGRINFWRASLRIAELHPIVGGGFRVTFWPAVANRMLEETTIPRFDKPRATHSIYFDVLSEHGWVGLALFLLIAACSWCNCSWLIRQSRDRPDLVWANLLGRMGQAALAGFWCAGAFASLAYFDQYWCIIFIFDAARLVVAKEIAIPAGTLVPAPERSSPTSEPAIGGAALMNPDGPAVYAKNPR